MNDLQISPPAISFKKLFKIQIFVTNRALNAEQFPVYNYFSVSYDINKKIAILAHLIHF